MSVRGNQPPPSSPQTQNVQVWKNASLKRRDLLTKGKKNNAPVVVSRTDRSVCESGADEERPNNKNRGRTVETSSVVPCSSFRGGDLSIFCLI